MNSSSDGSGIQLQPETILCAVTEAEVKLWNQGGLTDELEESLHTDDGELGNLILQWVVYINMRGVMLTLHSNIDQCPKNEIHLLFTLF